MLVVPAVVFAGVLCLSPSASRTPLDADQLNAAYDRLVTRCSYSLYVFECHTPHRPGELPLPLSFNAGLLHAVETM